MKKILSTLFAVALMTSVAFAQGPAVKNAETKLTKMAEVIELTDAQQTEVKAIFVTQAKEVAAAKKLGAGTEEAKAATKAANAKSAEALGDVLTPEQNKAWKKYLAEQWKKNSKK